MRYALQWLRSLIFITQMYLMMPLIGIVFFPWAIFSRRGALLACKTYCRWVRWTAGWMIGLRTEIRGTPPTDAVVIAAKHQSFLDILLIFGAIPAGKFIMKRELMWAPVIGQYALKIGCIPVNRGKRGTAIAQMVRDVAAEFQEPGQLIIYPQGTRVAPGTHKPYKVGSAVLYEELKQPCVPAATNAGVFWPRSGVLRKPGLAVVEFLEPIKAGVERKAFMARLEQEIEGKTAILLREAGFDTDATD